MSLGHPHTLTSTMCAFDEHNFHYLTTPLPHRKAQTACRAYWDVSNSPMPQRACCTAFAQAVGARSSHKAHCCSPSSPRAYQHSQDNSPVCYDANLLDTYGWSTAHLVDSVVTRQCWSVLFDRVKTIDVLRFAANWGAAFASPIPAAVQQLQPALPKRGSSSSS